MTALEILIDYFNNRCVVHWCRQGLLGSLDIFYKSKHAESTIDNIISLLVKANYIKRVIPGLYKVLRHIPEDITLTQLKQLATTTY